jgi:ABC-type transport system involved in multi-copper enzyme maturation permease subunit
VARKADKTEGKVVTFSIAFNLIFFTVLALTIFFTILTLVLAFSNPKTPYHTELQRNAFIVFLGFVEMGVGAIVGLLGGKLSN